MILAAMQRIIEAVQAALYRYGGALNKFLADDKGTTLIAAFNLPMPAGREAAIGVLTGLVEAFDGVTGRSTT